jgi:gliding motility-associated transport system ATP-binding protein
MIEAKNLVKRYGGFTALDQVSFNVQEGEVLGFLGPNGAGKTTTMRILTAYMPPSDGSATVAGYDVFEDSLEVRRRVGYLPETVPLYPEMSVRDYLHFAAALRGVPDRNQAVEEVMERVSISDRADDRIGKLSKGLRQRVGIAQALVHDPDVLLLDEPTIGLDPKQIIEVRELIRELGGDHTVILSTHILAEVSQICSRVLIINKGHIVAEDTPERLANHLKGAEQVHLVVAKPAQDTVDVLKGIPGVSNVYPGHAAGNFDIELALGSDRRPDIAAAAVHRGWDLLELRPIDMTLEDVFLQLTTDQTTTEQRTDDNA